MMERLSREEMLMEVAHVVARRGTCSRAQVGVVFAREGRILATGYNGAPPGVPHCTHESFTWERPLLEERGRTIVNSWPKWLTPILEHLSQVPAAGTVFYYDGKTVSTAPGCTVVSHAERNGISFAAGEGIRLRGADVYCTHAPCEDCAKSLLGAGIASLTYRTPYRLTTGVELLRSAGITVIDTSSTL